MLKREESSVAIFASVIISLGSLAAFVYIKNRKRQNVHFTTSERVHDGWTGHFGSDDAILDSSFNDKKESENTWIGNRDTSAKMDLLHKGANKGGKLLVVMVGLPGSFKTLIARKVARFLRWNSYNTRAFSIAKYRLDKLGSKSAEFFDPANTGSVRQRMLVLAEALEDAVRYLSRGGDIAILDGTNTTRLRRDLIRQRLARENNYEVLWIESKRGDDDINVAVNDMSTLNESPDFLNSVDYQRRVSHYRADYESVGDDEGPFVRIYNQFKKFTLHQTQGFLPTKIVSFVVNLKPQQKSVTFCRHGESTFNSRSLLGGDSGLTARGVKFSHGLAEFLATIDNGVIVWVSTMRRARETADAIPFARRRVEWRALNDIEAGVCDGMTYEGVKSRFPEEYRSRSVDKLRYRYPRGESYLDVIARLEPVIYELERHHDDGELVIIAHQAVLRCLYAYFLDLQLEEIPFLEIPLHTLIRLEPMTYGCREKRVRILVDAKSSDGKLNK